MTDDPLDELGPVDFIIVEFPAGEKNFTGEAADELLALAEAGSIRIIDLLILAKGDERFIAEDSRVLRALRRKHSVDVLGALTCVDRATERIRSSLGLVADE